MSGGRSPVGRVEPIARAQRRHTIWRHVEGILLRPVDTSRRHARAVVIAGLLIIFGAGGYSLHHIKVNTDTDQMFSAFLPWRQHQIAMDRAFPQFDGLLIAAIDARLPEEAEETGRQLGQGVTHGAADLAPYRTELKTFHGSMAAAIAGHPQPLSWQQMLSGDVLNLGGEYQFVVLKPRLDFRNSSRGTRRWLRSRWRRAAAVRSQRRSARAHHRPGCPGGRSVQDRDPGRRQWDDRQHRADHPVAGPRRTGPGG